jgi:hypothetical protein
MKKATVDSSSGSHYLQLAVVNVTSAPVAEPPALDIVAVKW